MPNIDGYWSFTARNGFSDGNYNINLNGTGFSTAIFDITRILTHSRRKLGFDGIMQMLQEQFVTE